MTVEYVMPLNEFDRVMTLAFSYYISDLTLSQVGRRTTETKPPNPGLSFVKEDKLPYLGFSFV